MIRVLIFGANYGILPAVRISEAGHLATLLGRADEAANLMKYGVSLQMTRRDGRPNPRIDCTVASGISRVPETIGVVHPADVANEKFDLIILAMAESHFAAPELRTLMENFASQDTAVLSLMNIPPPNFLRRISGFSVNSLEPAYSAWDMWKAIRPEKISAASPDAQAVKASDIRLGDMNVTLASNFKVAPFHESADQAIMQNLCDDIAKSSPDGIAPPMRFVLKDNLGAPLSKWPMLLTGNYRCLQPNGELRAIREAVWEDIEKSREIYEQTSSFVASLGNFKTELVPFRLYANAARNLRKPSSVARSLQAGAKAVERIDLLIQIAVRERGARINGLDCIVKIINEKTAANRA